MQIQKIIGAGLMATLCLNGFSEATAQQQNILLIAIDDLKPVLNCYGETQIKSPNIDKLAARSVVYTNAYCAWSVSGPSRASLLTGFTPDGSGVRNLTTLIRDVNPDVVTLPQFFKNNGYITAASGKVFDPRNVDDGHESASWSIPYNSKYTYPDAYDDFVSGNYRVTANTATECGPEGVDDDGYQDGQICLEGLARLDQFAANPDQPFFLAVGFKKPHIPFIAPKKYWDMYDRESIDLAPFQKQAVGSPDYVYYKAEPLGYVDIPDIWTFLDIEMGDGLLHPDDQRKLIHGYYASVSYIDAQVGKLLDKLEETGFAENTTIVLFGDHGYHLGDHNQWGKHTNFEHATHAPLMIFNQNYEAGTYEHPVDFIDIYPTLCNLTGYDIPLNLHGYDLTPTLSNTNHKIKDFAVSEYRSDGHSSYSFRTDRYRFTLWLEKSTTRPDVVDWSNVVVFDTELYDYETDPLETENQHGKAEYADVENYLMTIAEKWWNEQRDIIETGINQRLVESANEEDRNFFKNTWTAKNFGIPENAIQNEFSSNTEDAVVNIYLKDSINQILPTQLGVNSNFRSGVEMVTERIPLYEKSGWGIYRFPAGSGSNWYFWDGNIPDEFKVEINPIDGTESKNVTPADYVTFKKSLNSEATLVVNYFYARYGITDEGTREARVKQAAEYAAGFVHRMNVELEANIKYWEIGNECYGAWEEGYEVDGVIITGKEYGEDFRVFAEEMKKVDATIKVGAVVYSKDDETAKYGTWNRGVLPEVTNHADFLVVHNYFTSESDATVENVLASTVQIEEIKTMLDNVIESHAQKPRGYFPVAMTEYNCRGAHTTTMLNAIFTAEILGEFMKNDYGMATRWVNEWKWSVGTHSTIAVSDPDQADYTPRQAYMAYRYYNSYFGDYLINATSNADDVKVYASRFSDGKIGISIINQSSTPQNIKINLTDITENSEFTNAYWYEVYADNIVETNKKFYINGETGSTAGGGPDDFENVAPYKAEFKNNAIFEAKQYSINFMVIDIKKIEVTIGLRSQTNESDIKIYPNPFENKLIIDSRDKIQSVEIVDMNGKQIYKTEKSINQIDTQHLETGYYILKIKTSEERLVKKLVKI